VGILRMIATAGRVAKTIENTKHQDGGKIADDILSGIAWAAAIVVITMVLTFWGIIHFMNAFVGSH
jgi:hypothetical protein